MAAHGYFKEIVAPHVYPIPRPSIIYFFNYKKHDHLYPVLFCATLNHITSISFLHHQYSSYKQHKFIMPGEVL